MIALTRAVSPSIDRCELSHLERTPIDPVRAANQHARYEALLGELGCVVERVAAAPELPDGVFVEDAAVVVPELAVATRPGAASRRPEVESVVAALEAHRPVARLEAPATLDGGDVLRVGREVWVGASARTNAEGARQLGALLEPLGYRVRRVTVTGCLHLKTAVTAVAPDTLLVNPGWVDPEGFPGWRLLEVDPREPYAANALRVGETVVVAAAHPRTRERLQSAGVATAAVEVSELAKAEAGVTCCSVLLEAE